MTDRRTLLAACATLRGSACAANDHQRENPAENGQFVLEDGDGDPSWLHERHLIVRVDRSWFSGKSDEWYGDATLFQVLGPRHSGEFIALTPRTTSSIDEQLTYNGTASVVVHRFSCDPESAFENVCSTTAIGMTLLRRPGDQRFAE